MEFFDKKQDVMDVQLTRYGRQLLSRGKFKPAYYAFSDDEVIYDTRWVTGTLNQEQQSQVERRIQEDTPRIKTLNSKSNAEVTVFNVYNNTQLQNLIDLYNVSTDEIQMMASEEDQGPEEKEFQDILNSISLDVDFADGEKLLQYTLGRKRYYNDNAPAWNVIFYHGFMLSSAERYIKGNINKMVPQIHTTLADSFYRLGSGQKIFEIHPSLKHPIYKLFQYDTTLPPDADVDTGLPRVNKNLERDYLNNYFQNFSLAAGSVFVVKDFLFLSFEEANVDFTKDNFTLEVYEVIDTPGRDGIARNADDTEQLNRLIFAQKTGQQFLSSNTVEAYFDIQFDTVINEVLACSLINDERELSTKNIYTTNVFDCKKITLNSELQSMNVYDLDAIDIEEVCG